jgi:hypothetical protein
LKTFFRRRWICYCAVVSVIGAMATGHTAIALPASTHIAFGSMYHLEPGACTGQPVCTPERATLSIEASDSSTHYGSAVYEQNARVVISLDCVEILSDSLDHLLFASGKGPDGKTYYITIWDPVTGSSKFFVTDFKPTLSGPCNASSEVEAAYRMGTVGDFEIQP